MSPGEPTKKFCDAQVRKVVDILLTFCARDTRRWRLCAADFVDEECARRYLAGANWVASRAVLAITRTIRWRLDLGLRTSAACSGDCRWVHCCRGRCGDKGRPIRVSPVTDAEGRPVVVFTVRRWPRDDQDWLHMVIDALEVAAIQLREERWQRRRLGEDGGVGEAKETWTWLLDMEGAGPGDSPGLRTLRTLDEILAAHYPAKLGIVLVVNASGFVRLSIAVAERLVDEQTRAKLITIEDSEHLRRYIPKGDLEAVLAHGGFRASGCEPALPLPEGDKTLEEHAAGGGGGQGGSFLSLTSPSLGGCKRLSQD